MIPMFIPQTRSLSHFLNTVSTNTDIYSSSYVNLNIAAKYPILGFVQIFYVT